MIYEYEAVSGMRICRGTEVLGGKLFPVPICPPQIPYYDVG
jgi:hypothetical protein